jgi:hypothetical protein
MGSREEIASFTSHVSRRNLSHCRLQCSLSQPLALVIARPGKMDQKHTKCLLPRFQTSLEGCPSFPDLKNTRLSVVSP